MKIIEQNDKYNILLDSYDNLSILYRCWHNGLMEIKFDDNFAKANGYISTKDMINQTVGMNKILSMFGYIPEWIRLDKDGGYLFVDISSSNLN